MNELIKLVYFVEIVLRFIFLAFVRIVAESLHLFSTNVLLKPYMIAYSTFLAPLHWVRLC